MEPDDDKTQTHIALTKGTMVSHYRIVEKIGAGGMGEVYLAEDTQLDRKVALKFLPLHLCQDEDCRVRFKREAQAAAKLDHPNIVTVYEVGEYRGRPYFAMAHVEGQSLKEYSSGKDITIEQTLEIGIQICEGLHAAHDKGITHRDIKPSNILIDSHNRARIVDFGLASVVGKDKLTKTGSTLGTIGYMSPEQVLGKEVDHRSDLFSLGVVMYELITRRNPFKRDSEAATLKAVSDDLPEPLARFKSGLPEGMQAIIDKALEKDVKTRYQHADGMLSDLMRVKRSLESGESIVSVASRVRSSASAWSVAASVIIIATVIVLIVAKPWLSDTTPDRPDKIMLAVLPFENLGDPEDESFADGITDAITSRLGRISGLGVISRTSSMQYKNTDKSLPEIGRELDVNYILEGTVLCDKSGDTDRVRITPQLIEVESDLHIWTDNYERAMMRIFAVQADIATSIARELNITLLESERNALQDRPTENMEAYQAYLAARRNRWGAGTGGRYDPELAIRMYQRAVELDSSFALAYADLSYEHIMQYEIAIDHTEGRLQLAREAVDRALKINPELPEGHLTLGLYYFSGYREYERALEEFAIAERDLPNDPRVLRGVGLIRASQGRWEEALRKFERALRLNPQDLHSARSVIIAHIALRNYQEALRCTDKAISVHPDSRWLYQYKFNVYCVKGNVSGARSALLDGHFEHWLFWRQLYELERNYQAALDSLEPRRGQHFAHDLGFETVDEMAGLLYRYMGDSARAHDAFDSSRVFLESHREEYGGYIGFHSALGIAYAGLGRKEEAIREGKSSADQLPISKDAATGPALTEILARIYVMVGEYDAAINLLDSLLSFPNLAMSVGHLRTHPHWDPLRDHPRFQALLEKYDTSD